MRPKVPTIAITIGEPAGIGPEISLRAAWALRTECRPVLIGDFSLLTDLSIKIGNTIQLRSISIDECGHNRNSPDELEVIDLSLALPVTPGILDSRNELAVLNCIDLAIIGAAQKKFDAIVTAPVQKSAINEAGIAFTGHTEYLAWKTNTDQVVMMLSGHVENNDAPLRVALATTHLALQDVPKAITFDNLLNTVKIIHTELQQKFGIKKPRILLTGLNPHAGEGGYLGSEEINIIKPVIAAAQKLDIDARGPYPADTIFQPHHLINADCVLAMYHDQGLPVLKYGSFGKGVNITLGLPIIRTSVDHGTALDIASQGTGHADYGSMIEAIRIAVQMAGSQTPLPF